MDVCLPKVWQCKSVALQNLKVVYELISQCMKPNSSRQLNSSIRANNTVVITSGSAWFNCCSCAKGPSKSFRLSSAHP